MDKYHETKQTMYNAVVTLLNNNTARFVNFQALKNNLVKFTAVVALIKAAFVKVDKEDKDSSGKTGDKSAAREALLDALLPVMCNLHSYALDNNDNVLLSKVEKSEWEVRKVRDQDLVDTATNIHDAAVPITSKLVDYLITDVVLADIQSKIDTFSGLLGEQSSGGAAHTGSRASMPTLFKQADDLLEKHIDNNMVSMRKSEPEFYNQYLSARQIKVVGVRHNHAPAPQAPEKAK